MQTYIVEAIVDRRFDRKTNKPFYFVKWQGYDSSVNTWEPIEHLEMHCMNLIEQFQQKARHFQNTSIAHDQLQRNDLQKKKKVRKGGKKKKQTLSSKLKLTGGTQNFKRDNIFGMKNEEEGIDSNPVMEEEISSQQKIRENFGFVAQNNLINSEEFKQKQKQRQHQRYNGFYQNSSFLKEESQNLSQASKNRKFVYSNLRKMDDSQYEEDFSLSSSSSNSNQSDFEIGKKKRISKKKNQRGKNLRNKNNLPRIIKAREQSKQVNPQLKQQILPKQRAQSSIQLLYNNIVDLQKNSYLQQQPKASRKIEQKQSRPKVIVGEKKQQIQILGLSYKEGKLQFYIQTSNSIRRWEEHDYILDNYSRQLSLFYEKHLEFD